MFENFVKKKNCMAQEEKETLTVGSLITLCTSK